jgi:hypothetical protein
LLPHLGQGLGYNMRFKTLQPYRGRTKEDLDQYLNITLPKLIKELDIGLRNLDIEKNTNSFIKKDIVIAATTEVSVVNELRDSAGNKLIPTKWAVLDKVCTSTSDIVRGDTAWTTDLLYLVNRGGTSATVKVIFWK